MLRPKIGSRRRFPCRPETGYTTSSSYSTPPSRSRRPAPIVSGSSVSSGRCCANALAAAREIITLMRAVRIVNPTSELPFAVDQDGHRAVVDQLDAHHGLEFARGNGQLSRAQFSHDAFVQRAGMFRRGRGVEGPPPALPDVAEQRELRDDQDAPEHDDEATADLTHHEAREGLDADARLGDALNDRPHATAGFEGGWVRIRPRAAVPRCRAARRSD